ncbi:MAG: DUF5666 domain-containing protein [Candidatus Krumholzibacteria bacterium]|nr:DUF5666 domain-containing protein [Candidatus Krumholzibacteria bacterium]
MRVLRTITERAWLANLIALVAFFALLSSCSSDSPTGPGSSAPGSMTIMSQRDTDGDGMIDLVDPDDDNDGESDDMDSDDDNDGIPDDQEEDSDDDGTIDDHDDDFVKIEGTISAKGDSQIVVFNIVVRINAETRIFGEFDEALTFDALAVQMRVEVYGILNADNSVTAVKIEIEDDQEDEINPALLQEGDFVQVKAFADNQGGYALLEVVRHMPQDHFEYEGALEGAGADAVTLGGVDFMVDGGTEFRDEAHTGKTLADLAAGDRVDINATYIISTDKYHADRIRTEDNGESFLKVEATVSVINMTERILVVGGVTVHF